MEEKKNELNDTMLEINNKTIATTPMKFQPMPRLLTWLILMMKKILVPMKIVIVDYFK